MEITILKGNNFYMEWVKRLLQEELPEKNIRLRDSADPAVTELLLVSLDTDIEWVRSMQKQKIKVAVITLSTDKRRIREYLKLDLEGYIFLEMEIVELAAAIEKILNGERYVHPYFTDVLFRDHIRVTKSKMKRPAGLLTDREWQVLEKMSEGYNNEMIAAALYISEKTVKNHVSSILKELEVEDRINAILMAIKNDWVKLD